jgi:hypothetical protein
MPKSHKEWIKDIEGVTGGVVEFPLFCDPELEAATQLGILDQTNKHAKGMPLTVRSVFIVKPDRTIALMTYPASAGRNFLEIIRCIDSLPLTPNKAVATPVDRFWQQGNDVIVNFLSPTRWPTRSLVWMVGRRSKLLPRLAKIWAKIICATHNCRRVQVPTCRIMLDSRWMECYRFYNFIIWTP